MDYQSELANSIIKYFINTNEGSQLAQHLEEFAEAIPGGFFIYHANEAEELIYANTATLRLFNCDTLDEFRTLTGNSFKGIVHPDDLEKVEQSIVEQIATSQYDLDYVEYRIIPKGGGIRWVDDYGHFVRCGFGGIFYVFIGDSTEKHTRLHNDPKLEIIQQEHLRRLEMIEGLSIDYESIFYADLDRNHIKAYRVSERFEKQFPIDQQICDFAGFDTDYINEWVYPDDRGFLFGITTPEYIRDQLSENKSFHVNYRIFRNGKPAYIQLRIVNVGSDDHVSQIVLGYRNIDAEIMQEVKQKQILKEALAEATLANNAKNTFLSNMSHDILTPMNAIVGFTTLAQKYVGNTDKVSCYLDMITASSNQLLQLLNDTLEISRIESGKIHVDETSCNILDLLQQIQSDFLPRTTEKNITFSLDICTLKHETVYADKQKLCEIFTYLVDNAVKYTKVGGRIMLRMTELDIVKDNHISYQFDVEDNGIGMSEAFLPHIFDAFEREQNTTASGIPGTGLGLTITMTLVKMLGGTIDVTSTVGAGSCFTVTLPLCVPDMSSTEPSHTDTNAALLPNNIRILVVDDNELNLEIECEVLKDAGFLVDTAKDGSVALDKVQNAKPGYYNLVLMDIQMPVMNGYHAARAIRSLKDPQLASIPIIAVSANTYEEDKKLSLQSGMNAHLGKPLDTPRLYQLIHQILESVT